MQTLVKMPSPVSLFRDAAVVSDNTIAAAIRQAVVRWLLLVNRIEHQRPTVAIL